MCQVELVLCWTDIMFLFTRTTGYLHNPLDPLEPSPTTLDPQPPRPTIPRTTTLDPQPLDPQPLDPQPPRPTIKNLLIVAIFMVCYLRGGGGSAVDY